MAVINTAREDMEVITEELRIKAAPRVKISPATKYYLQVGQRFRVYRKKELMVGTLFVK